MRVSIVFAIAGILMFLFLGYFHEQVHVAIFRSYGIESRVEYIKNFPDFTTYPKKECPTEECLLANNINEVVGYQAMPFFILLMIGFFIIIMILEENEIQRQKWK